MDTLNKTVPFYLLLLIFILFTLTGVSDNIVSYAYDNAGNRISRKVVDLNSNPSHAKKDTTAVLAPPVIEQLGDRAISIYPNPTKGALAVDITGGNVKDELRILLLSSQGVQLQMIKAVIGRNTVDMQVYSTGWYILRIQAGDKVTEFKIIKQ